MVDALASMLAQLQLDVQRLSGSAFDARITEEENRTYRNHAPCERARPSVEDLKTELERDFLTPSPKFSPEWLNRLQRFVLFRLAFQSRSTN